MKLSPFYAAPALKWSLSFAYKSLNHGMFFKKGTERWWFLCFKRLPAPSSSVFPMLFLHGFCSKVFVHSVSLTRSGISLREGQPDELQKLGRCFWKKHLFIYFLGEKKKKSPITAFQRASGFFLQPPSSHMRILARLQRQPSSAWSRLGCLWEEGKEQGHELWLYSPHKLH